MYSFEVKIRVRYGETDQMGYVYYGYYAQYYEVARTESLRALGISYKELEELGYMLPVRSLSINYLKPAYYDDELLIKVMLKESPKAKIHFDYECYNQKKELLNTGSTDLVFVSKTKMKPCAAPQILIEALKTFN